MPPKVLVIDSVAIVAYAIAKAIEATGAHVSMAASLKAAERLIAARSYTLAILDADVNGTSTETLAGTLVERRTTVIVCSTHPSQDAWTKDYITLPKPIPFNVLSKLVDDCQPVELGKSPKASTGGGSGEPDKHLVGIDLQG